MTIYFKYKKYIILGVILILISSLIVYYLTFNKKEKVVYITSKTSEVIIANTFFVDVKGAVNKPGVYEFVDGDKVLDAINMAGGLSKYATTSNINLSKKLTSEMVVYVFKKNDLVVQTTTIANPCKCETVDLNNCITTTKNENSDITGKVNINTATISELGKLSGIGEAKAKSIIDYREKNGNFKSVDDIKNVSGLGDLLFAKIKDYITI